jgi:hypothetical protein
MESYNVKAGLLITVVLYPMRLEGGLEPDAYDGSPMGVGYVFPSMTKTVEPRLPGAGRSNFTSPVLLVEPEKLFPLIATNENLLSKPEA